MHKSLFLLPCFLLACSGPAADEAAVDLGKLQSMSLRATGNISLPEPMTAAAFVPNHVASWASHILLLSETGDIWRTTTEEDKPSVIAKGAFTDIYGLSRPQKAGVFLAVSGNEQGGGELTAFIESDDQGNFNPIAVSQSGAQVSRFCAGSAGDTHWVIGADKSLYRMSANVKDDMIAEITYANSYKPKYAPTECYVDAADALIFKTNNGQWYSYSASGAQTSLEIWDGGKDVSPAGTAGQIGVDPQTGAPLFAVGGVLSALTIEDGLSIQGIGKASFIASTGYNMGSVFDEGIIIIGDAEDDRIVLISTGYVQRASQR